MRSVPGHLLSDFAGWGTCNRTSPYGECRSRRGSCDGCRHVVLSHRRVSIYNSDISDVTAHSQGQRQRESAR
jgi:hypothetical protein